MCRPERLGVPPTSFFLNLCSDPRNALDRDFTTPPSTRAAQKNKNGSTDRIHPTTPSPPPPQSSRETTPPPPPQPPPPPSSTLQDPRFTEGASYTPLAVTEGPKRHHRSNSSKIDRKLAKSMHKNQYTLKKNFPTAHPVCPDHHLL